MVSDIHLLRLSCQCGVWRDWHCSRRYSFGAALPSPICILQPKTEGQVSAHEACWHLWRSIIHYTCTHYVYVRVCSVWMCPVLCSASCAVYLWLLWGTFPMERSCSPCTSLKCSKLRVQTVWLAEVCNCLWLCADQTMECISSGWQGWRNRQTRECMSVLITVTRRSAYCGTCTLITVCNTEWCYCGQNMGLHLSWLAEAQWKCATDNWKLTKSSECAPGSLKAEQGAVEYAPSLAQSLTRVVGYAPYIVERDSRPA